MAVMEEYDCSNQSQNMLESSDQVTMASIQSVNRNGSDKGDESNGDDVICANNQMSGTDGTDEQLGDNDIRPIANVEDYDQMLEQKGRTATTLEELRAVYHRHADMIGFSYKLSTTRHFKHNDIIKEKYFVCSRSGKPHKSKGVTKTPSPMPDTSPDGDGQQRKIRKTRLTRTGCKAQMRVLYSVQNKNYEVVNHIVEHNHELTRPEWAYLNRANRKISGEKGKVIESMELSRLKPTDGFRFMAQNACGLENVGHTLRDHVNYVNRLRKEKTGGADAQTLLGKLQSRQQVDPEYYYKPMFDEENRLCGLFWADSMMREDYKLYGDVLVFDTTYRTNKYELVCAPFVGINNHWSNAMFGCAFIANEKTETFVWLLNNFLHAMGNKKPLTIFTDQDAAMAKAISQVFGEDTRHRLCVWHIEQNMVSHCGRLKGNNEFKNAFEVCLKVCTDPAKFETNWQSLVETYNLYAGNEENWFKRLYGIKDKWCRALNRDSFSAGILSSQRSESTNHALSYKATKQTSLTQFLDLFDATMERWRATEVENEFKCSISEPKLYSRHSMIKQTSQVYTTRIFERFQSQFKKSLLTDVHKQVTGNDLHMFRVTPHDEDDIVGMVIYVEDDMGITLKCNCMLYEECGWLCFHCIRILQSHNVRDIPEKYILARWTKNVKKHVWDKVREKRIGMITPLEFIAWRHQMNRDYCELVLKCETNDTARTLLEDSYQRDLVTIQQILQEQQSSTIASDPTTTSAQSESVVLDPAYIKTKGRSKKRIQNKFERPKKAVRPNPPAAPKEHLI